ncbi:hypothetical protein D3C75_1380570 [compost metagenome]
MGLVDGLSGRQLLVAWFRSWLPGLALEFLMRQLLIGLKAATGANPFKRIWACYPKRTE